MQATGARHDPGVLIDEPVLPTMPTWVSGDMHLPRLSISPVLPNHVSYAGRGLIDTNAATVLGIQHVAEPVVVDVATSAGSLERNDEPDPDYAHRRGYDPNFLSQAVAVPTISSGLLQLSRCQRASVEAGPATPALQSLQPRSAR